MNQVFEKVDASIELIDSISTYYDEFHKLLTDKRIAEKLDEEIKSVIHSSRDKLLKRLKAFESNAVNELSFEDISTLVFQTYQLLQEYETLISRIDKQLTDWNVFVRPDIITSDISHTKLTDISRQSTKLSLMLINFKRKYEDFDVEVVKNLSDYIIKKIDISSVTIDKIKFLQDLFRKYPLTIDVYSILLQTIMDENKNLITNILQIIEQDKSYILGDTKSTYTELKIRPVQNPSHRYFGLVPSNVCKPLDQLFPNFGKKSIEEDLTDIAAAENISIIYMRKFTAYPIEFSVWKLTRIEDAALYVQAEQNKNSGLSASVIERMKIINYIDPPEKQNRWNLSEYSLFGSNDSDIFYILDSFNNKTFRFLRPWIGVGNKVPRSYINGLLTYMGIIKGNKRDRISIYNEAQENEIMNHIFLRQPIDVEELVSDVQADMDAPKLKQELVPIITKILKTPKNWAELGGIIHSVDIIDEFADGLIKLYPTHFKDNIALDKRVQFPFSETLSTFLAELNNVKKSFGRALHERYIKTTNDMKITAFKSKDNIQLFIVQLVKNALDDVITNKSNVYSSLLMKNKILTIELNESDIDKKVGGRVNSNIHNSNVKRNTLSYLYERDYHDELYL